VRGAAADLLGTLKDDRAHETLVKVSRTDPSQWVRSRATDALDRLLPETSAKPPNGPKLTPPPDTLELVRSQAAELPSLDDNPALADPDALSADQIQTMLDNLDLRLANGEISEETYHTLYARWHKRLADLGK
jgi:HEAT repeat protein